MALNEAKPKHRNVTYVHAIRILCDLLTQHLEPPKPNRSKVWKCQGDNATEHPVIYQVHVLWPPDPVIASQAAMERICQIGTIDAYGVSHPVGRYEAHKKNQPVGAG